MSKLSDWIRKTKHTTASAVVLAAGSSQRMGEDKLFMRLEGMPVLARTLSALNACSCIDEIILVTRAESLEQVSKLCRDYGILKCKKVVIGGASRTESALRGVTEVRRDAKLIAIHDGARPLVSEELVYGAVHGAALYKAAAPSVPVADTVKLAENNEVSETLPREQLAAVQTPQVFQADIIKTALTKALADQKEYTDDCAAVEALGVRVHLTSGSRRNLKITTPMDMELASAMLRNGSRE